MILVSRVNVPHEFFACTGMLKVIKDKIIHLSLNEKLTRNLKPFFYMYKIHVGSFFHFVDVNEG